MFVVQYIKRLASFLAKTVYKTLNLMRWNFFRIAIRQANFHKAQAVIKILGLSVGIATCLLVFLVIRFETSFDDFHPGRDHIYRVVSVFHTPGGIAYEPGVPFPTAIPPGVWKTETTR